MLLTIKWYNKYSLINVCVLSKPTSVSFSFYILPKYGCVMWPGIKTSEATEWLVYYVDVTCPFCCNLQVSSSKSQLHQLRNSFLINVPKKHISVSCFAKSPGMEHFNGPTKLVVLLSNTQKKLWNLMPDSVKSFPWKKAETVALEEFLVLGKETLKWCLLACFALSCLSDILYSISRNKELVIPLGLFVGIMTSKFFDEISRDLMPEHQVKMTQIQTL